MPRIARTIWVLLTSLSLLAGGCAPRQPFYFFEDGDLSHYVGAIQKLEYPDSEQQPLDEAAGTAEPLTLSNPKFDQIWSLSLEEAIRTALENGKVLRNLGGRFASFGGPRPQTGEPAVSLLTSPAQTPSIYDPAIVETDPFRGVESALAAFDAQLSMTSTWQNGIRPQNIDPLFQTVLFVPVLKTNTGVTTTGISKTTATGGQFGVSNFTQLDATNNLFRDVPSTWTTGYDFTFSQPLLQGAGVAYNRIAGPDTFNNLLGRPNFRGVLLARINADISLADFEAGVRNLVSDTEQSYWELYFAFRNLEARKAGRDSALEAWRKVHALYVEQSRGGEADKEAQAREQYFFFRSEVEQALTDVYRCENRLRYMMGISASDGRLIRPADEPTTARISFDWQQSLVEALSRSAELRKQKWVIKQKELELTAAKNLLLPRLDVGGRYRFLGVGENLLSQRYFPYPQPGVPVAGRPTKTLQSTDAYSSLLAGEFQEWQAQAQFLMPLGFRRELSTVRNHQLQLARERARLQDEELEASHALVEASRNVDTNFALSQTNFNRRVAAERQVEAVQAAYDAGTVTLDQLLDAQRRRAEAESAYARAIVDYNRSIAQLHYRKGSLLEYNGVFLAEGPWPGKAYFDAHRRARQRDASLYLDYGHSRPGVFSRGPITQNFESIGADARPIQLPPRDPATKEPPAQGQQPGPGGSPTPADPSLPLPELLPAPPHANAVGTPPARSADERGEAVRAVANWPPSAPPPGRAIGGPDEAAATQVR
ncbi:MAG: TolC family protein [Planctomycetia bacterium]|nr:TolC family protein [Planctomycetia bacterium]